MISRIGSRFRCNHPDRSLRAYARVAAVPPTWAKPLPTPVRNRRCVRSRLQNECRQRVSHVDHTGKNAGFAPILHSRISPEDDEADWSDADKLDSFSQPTTIGAVLLALSEAMDMDPREWLNEPDLTLLRQAT